GRGRARLAVRGASGCGGVGVPDRDAAPVLAHRALDLVRRGGRAPHEAVGEGEESGRGGGPRPCCLRGHPFTAPCMIPPMIWRPRTRKIASSGRIEMNVPVSTRA